VPSKNNRRPTACDLILLCLHILTLIFYFLATRAFVTTRTVEIALDRLIPLIPFSIVIYHLWYPTLAVTGLALFLKNRPVFRRYLLGLIIVYVSSILFFAVFPTYVPRPNVGNDTLFTKILRETYRVDAPYCGLPSLHVGSLTVAAHTASSLRRSRTVRLIYLIWLFLIALTTLTTKQHVFLDLPGGIVFGLMSAGAAGTINRLFLNRSCR
jgi:hypothetical protein